MPLPARTALLGCLSLTASLLALAVPSQARVDETTEPVQDTHLTPGQVYSYPSSVAFEWEVAGAPEGTVVEIHYRGCDENLGGYIKLKSPQDGAFSVDGNPSKLGPKWYYRITVKEPDEAAYSTVVKNEDESLRFKCSNKEEPLIKKWSKPTGPVKRNPTVGDVVKISKTKLNSFGKQRGAIIEYAWELTIDGNDYTDLIAVDKRKLKIKKDWVGETLYVSSLAYTEEGVWAQRSPLIKYGTIGR